MSRRPGRPPKHDHKAPQPPAPAARPEAPIAPPPRVELDAQRLRGAMQRRLSLQTPAQGVVAFPAVPGKVDEFVGELLGTFAAIHRAFGERDRATFRASLLEQLKRAFEASPYASLQVSWNTDDKKRGVIHWRIEAYVPPPEERYEPGPDADEPPLLAMVPDTRLLRLARELGAPRDVTFLDVGAANGRNTLALARLGHPTDAVEPVEKVADALERLVAEEALGGKARVLRGDFWDPAFELPRPAYRLVRFTEVGGRMRGLTSVRALLRRLAASLEPGGAGLLHVFVAREGYLPDPVTREFAEAVSCPVYTREELEDAAFGLPLRLESDEPVVAYERRYLEPAGAWPPAPWYAAWASGAQVFELTDAAAPMELRWLVYKRARARERD